MQSQDEYLTIAIFDAKMETLIKTIELGNEKLRNELREEFNAKLEKVRADVDAKIDKLDAKIDKVDAKVDSVREDLTAKIDKVREDLSVVQTQISVVSAQVEDVKFFQSLSVGVIGVIVGLMIFSPLIVKLISVVRNFFMLPDITRMMDERIAQAFKEREK